MSYVVAMSLEAELHLLRRSSFGDSPELPDELLELILIGNKRATCWSAAEGAPETVIGGRWIVEDGKGRPRAVVKTIDLCQQRFDLIDENFAAAEGEGNLSLSYWQQAHRDFFARNGGFTPDMLLWCERFELVQVLSMSE